MRLEEAPRWRSDDPAGCGDATLELGRAAHHLMEALERAIDSFLARMSSRRFSKSMRSSSRRRATLLPPRRVLRPQCVALVLHLRQHVPLARQLDLEVRELLLAHLVLGLHELELLLEVGEHLHGGGRLLAQLEQLLVRPSIFSFSVWFSILSCSKSIRWRAGAKLLLLPQQLELAQVVAPVDVGEAEALDLAVLIRLRRLERTYRFAGIGFDVREFSAPLRISLNSTNAALISSALDCLSSRRGSSRPPACRAAAEAASARRAAHSPAPSTCSTAAQIGDRPTSCPPPPS